MNNIRWSPFPVSDFFDIFTGSDLILSRTKKGEIPVITHQEGNNGIGMFAEKLSRPLMDHKDTISLADRGTFKAYTQPTDFYIGTRVKALKFRDGPVSGNILVFLTTAINAQQKLFSYGYNATNNVGRINIMLPIDDNGNPNWKFMDEYISKKVARENEVALKFLSEEKSKIGNFESLSLKDRSWESFTIGDIADIKNGVRLTKADIKKGNRPFIGATDKNNGITNFVSNTNGSLDSNVLGINYNGSVCEGFYHPYESIFSDDVKRITFKNGVNNEYTLLFMITAIKKQKAKFAYGYKFNATRMAKTKILLPIDTKGNIDYKFMENYIKQIKKDKLERVVSFKENNLG